MYNVEGKCNVWKSVGEVQDLPYNETEIVLKKKAVRYAVKIRIIHNTAERGRVLSFPARETARITLRRRA